MKNKIKYSRGIVALIGVALLALTVGLSTATPVNADNCKKTDTLFIGDAGDDTVKRFDAETGHYLGAFVAPGSGGLHGPTGLIFVRDKLLVSKQNVGLPFSGEILQYSRDAGDFLDALVPCNGSLGRACDPNTPLAPRGIIRSLSHTLYVTDYGDFSTSPPTLFKVERFDDKTGKFLGNLDTTGFLPPFYPRGVVFGPDGLLYVSATGNLAAGEVTTGYILRFTPITANFSTFSPAISPTVAPRISTGRKV